MVRLKTRSVEWATAILTLPGQDECGDQHVITDVPTGTLVAVVDGLGHGPEAAAVAERAISVIEQHRARESLAALVHHCDEELRGSRGAVMSLASFDADDRTLTWLGIGNITGVLLRRTPTAPYPVESLLLHPGVLGRQVGRVKAVTTRIGRGDLVVIATDGVESRFADALEPEGAVADIAEGILADHGKTTDDALVLAVRYIG